MRERKKPKTNCVGYALKELGIRPTSDYVEPPDSRYVWNVFEPAKNSDEAVAVVAMTSTGGRVRHIAVTTDEAGELRQVPDCVYDEDWEPEATTMTEFVEKHGIGRDGGTPGNIHLVKYKRVRGR